MITPNEVGKYLRINTRYDLSGATALELTVTRPDGSSFTRNNPALTVGTVDVTVDGVTLLANQYVNYQTQAGDLPDYGHYLMKLKAEGNGQILYSEEHTLPVSR